MGGLASNELDTNDRVRLHITPFNRELFDKIIPFSVRTSVSDISFHSVQTFPDRGFGYIELPVMEAQKLKQKLNGSTLKGAKVRIETAKPEKKRKVDAEEDEMTERKARKVAKKEKRKREEGVIPGHQLKEGRRVKRGWTDDTEDAKDGEKRKKKHTRSQAADEATDGRKLRFKASVPPNAVPIDSDSKTKIKKRKSKEGKNKVLVQEFEKSKKSANINTTSRGSKHGAVEFQDGVGWVDEVGNVVEADRATKRSKRSKGLPNTAGQTVAITNNVHKMSDGPTAEHMEIEETPTVKDDRASSPSSETDREAAAEPEAAEPEQVKEVHPLEALFKRPATSPSDSAKPRPKPIDTSFNFFNADTADDIENGDDTGGAKPPQTPHTKRDLEWRSIRSAAPTPDTAAIGRKFSFPFAEGIAEHEAEDHAEAEDGQDAEMKDSRQAHEGAENFGGEGRGEESAFRKWFYDNRGDLNRGWKKRRREERKSKRQRENRRLSSKVAAGREARGSSECSNLQRRQTSSTALFEHHHASQQAPDAASTSLESSSPSEGRQAASHAE
ncbi:hypothetical protein LTR37_001335 [Vermiconidia calcicola]|uniref:Uncharacterized protein n=1 Tax=Vermiconidia calcicola TaxID=1690605 RepID=A0ACC3NWI3_9PEZI|nr:hypothetical protein LTR37_001335 [Vermiconidia calcicola]